MSIDRSAFGADVFADAIDCGERSVMPGGTSTAFPTAQVAQELLRLDSTATHAAVLVSGSPPGPVHIADRALSHQRNLQTVFAQCAAQPACQRAFPTLEADFRALYDEFSAKPLEVPVAAGPPARTVLLNGERFIMEMRQGFGQPANIRRVPLLIHELRRGDRAAALGRMIGNGVISPWDPLGHVVQCNEYGAGYRAAVAATMPLLTPAFQAVADDFREHCDLWLPQPTRQSDTRPMVSDVPTLVVHGEYDPTEVQAAQQRITAGLKNAYSYTFPGQGHAGQTVGCYGAIIQQFLENPARAPDSSCITKMPGIQFKTTPGYAPTTTFLIGGNAAGQLAGEWETTLLGGPDFTFQLESDGSDLHGSVRESLLPIFDGRIDSTTISFKVKTPDAARIIVFTGTLRGDELEFTRRVEIVSPNQSGSPGLFGTTGPGTFRAKRLTRR
jgi:pimeloyl-ACP methyl ester carboxylesterase